MPGDDEVFRRFLQTRLSMGEPDVVLPTMTRREARRAARRAALRGGEALAALGDEGPETPEPADAPDADRAGEGSRKRAGGPGTADEAGPAPPGDRDDLGRLAREGTAGEITDLPDLEALRAVAERCVRCPLHETRQQVVFGEGDPDARLVCVGEAPGAREDETGRPFVGRAGQLLDRLLLAVGYRREEVYICNVLKSRPPGNRDPKPEEIEACAPYLVRQLELIDPEVIVAFGAFAARTLLDASGSLGSLRGRTHEVRGFPLVATYHPAALLRNPRWRRPTWRDLRRARRIVDGEVS